MNPIWTCLPIKLLNIKYEHSRPIKSIIDTSKERIKTLLAHAYRVCQSVKPIPYKTLI